MELVSTIIVIIGVTQGLFIGLALLLDKVYASTENKYIGLTLILLSLQGILDILSFWKMDKQYLWAELINFFGFQGIILLPYFLSVLKSLKARFFLPLWTLFIPFILSVIQGIMCFIVTLLGKKASLWDRLYLDEFWLFHWYFNILFVVLLHLYLLRLIVKASSNINKKGALALWLAFGVLIAFWLSFNLLDHYFNSESYYFFTFSVFWGVITLFMFWFTYTGVVKQRLTNEQKSLHLILKEKQYTTTSNDTVVKTNPYFEHFIRLLEDKKIYRDAQLNRDKVARKLGISSGYFSTLLNEVSSQSFNEIINEYRVKEVKQILSDGSLDHFSLTAIGLEVGFKSKSSFFANFKKLTHSTPSEYKHKKQS